MHFYGKILCKNDFFSFLFMINIGVLAVSIDDDGGGGSGTYVPYCCNGKETNGPVAGQTCGPKKTSYCTKEVKLTIKAKTR